VECLPSVCEHAGHQHREKMMNFLAQPYSAQKLDGATVLPVADLDTILVHQNLQLVQAPIPQYLETNEVKTLYE
jgi:hypothetical protein